MKEKNIPVFFHNALSNSPKGCWKQEFENRKTQEPRRQMWKASKRKRGTSNKKGRTNP